MKRYAIYAYESLYGGNHGMYSRLVVEAEDHEEACEIALQESLNVIDSYSKISNELYDSAVEEYDFDHDGERDEFSEDEIEGIYASMCEEDTAYNIWPINENVASSYSTEDLNTKFYHDPETFIKRFCEE